MQFPRCARRVVVGRPRSNAGRPTGCWAKTETRPVLATPAFWNFISETPISVGMAALARGRQRRYLTQKPAASAEMQGIKVLGRIMWVRLDAHCSDKKREVPEPTDDLYRDRQLHKVQIRGLHRGLSG